jgi:hypothetical protein
MYGRLYYYLIVRRDLISKLNIDHNNQIPRFEGMNVNQVFHNSNIRFNEEDMANTRLVLESVFGQTVSFSKFIINDKQSRRKNSVKQYNVGLCTTINEDCIYDFFFKLHFFMSFDQKQYSYLEEIQSFCIMPSLVIKKKINIRDFSLNDIVEQFSKRILKAVVDVRQSQIGTKGLYIVWDRFDNFVNIPIMLRKRARLLKSNFFINLRLKNQMLYNTVRIYLLLFSAFRMAEYFRLKFE